MLDCTIYVGTWNLEKVIDEIVDGVLLQDCPVVFVDNSSTDKTVEKIIAKIPDAKIITTKHDVIRRKNINKFHIEAINDCKTEYIFFLDGDIFLPAESILIARSYFVNDKIGGVAIQYGSQDHVQTGASLYKLETIKGFLFDDIVNCTCKSIKNYLDKLNLILMSVDITGVKHIKGIEKNGEVRLMEVVKNPNGTFKVVESVERTVSKQMLQQQIDGLKVQLAKMEAMMTEINKVVENEEV